MLSNSKYFFKPYFLTCFPAAIFSTSLVLSNSKYFHKSKTQFKALFL